MKNLIVMMLSLFVFSTASLSASSLPGDVPKKVKEAFMKMHPDAEDVEWEMEDGNYEAEYEMGGYEMESLFDANGNELKCVVEVEGGELPVMVFNAVMKDYKGWEIEDVDVEEKNGKMMYEVEVESDEGVEYGLWYDSNGKLMKKEMEDDD